MFEIKRKVRERITALIMMTPALAGLGLFLVWPAVYAAYLGFTDYTLTFPIKPPNFVGLQNFIRMFTQDPAFVQSVINTIYFVALVVPVQVVLSLCLALLVNKKVRGAKIFRAVFFFPTIMALVVVSVIWSLLYKPSGVINAMLSRFGIGPIPFLTSSALAMPSIVLTSVWQGAGFHMVIFLAGLQAIPKRLYEAASIDGANAWQKFRHITLPQLKPTTMVVVVITTIYAFRVFVQPFVMTHGGPNGATRSIIMSIYENGIDSWNLGYSCAMAVFFFLMVLLISIFQRKFLAGEE